MATNTEQFKSDLPVVALVGRVNVGKSTLFNKLIEEQKAIISNVPGTTRTSNEGRVLWRGQEFTLIDTGGLTFSDDIEFEEDILKQSETALKRADIIVFVTDAIHGVLPQERELAKRLRRVEIKPVVLVANKVDTPKVARDLTNPEWYKLGLGEPFPISAASGRNVGDFLDHLFTLFETRERKPKSPKKQMDEVIDVTLIGKPNVGKSSLFNKLIGEDKVIVSDMAHTTREPHDTLVTYDYTVDDEDKKQYINFIDTAGIRRKTNVKGQLERVGIRKSIETLERSDIILFVIDGAEPISHQDKQLGGMIERKSKSVVILVNKWDLAEDNSQKARSDVKKMLLYHFPHLDFAEIMFVSGKTGTSVHKIFPTLMQIWRARHTEIPRRTLDLFLEQATKKHLPSRGKGTRHPKLLGIKQINSAPPIFELSVKYRTSLHRSYIRYLENRLREQFNFIGTPIVIKLRKMRK